MSSMFVIMIALLVLVFYIKGRITQLQDNIQEKIDIATSISGAGGKAVELAVEKIRDFMEKKNQSSKKN